MENTNLRQPLQVLENLGPADQASSQFQTAVRLTLPFDQRQRSRLLVRLDDGREAGLMLERGMILRDGDGLRAVDGTVIVVQAAPEPVSTVQATEPRVLARAAYHLGNRHVPLQVDNGWLRYQADHVLDDMVRNLGLSVIHEEAPFEPEGGAYGGGHAHSHSQDHGHEHGHALAPGHTHGHEHGHDHSHFHEHESISNPQIQSLWLRILLKWI